MARRPTLTENVAVRVTLEQYLWLTSHGVKPGVVIRDLVDKAMAGERELPDHQ